MPTITALLPQPRKRDLLNLFLDGEFALTLHRTLAQEAGLFTGRELSSEELRALTQRETLQNALDAAFRFLAYRPRSEAEVRARLRRRKVEAELIEQTVARLKELRLLDDATFARQWAENRAAFSPRSRALVRWELRLKGVDQALAQEAVEELDDDQTAYQAALRRTQRLKAADYQEFRKRMWDYLRRRGFSYAVTTRTIERLWRERTDGASSEGAEVGPTTG